jgi:hypothetical protein
LAVLLHERKDQEAKDSLLWHLSSTPETRVSVLDTGPVFWDSEVVIGTLQIVVTTGVLESATVRTVKLSLTDNGWHHNNNTAAIK